MMNVGECSRSAARSRRATLASSGGRDRDRGRWVSIVVIRPRVADARVEERVGEVGDERGQQEDDADDQDAALQERKVLVLWRRVKISCPCPG